MFGYVIYSTCSGHRPLLACFCDVRGNLRTWRKPRWTRTCEPPHRVTELRTQLRYTLDHYIALRRSSAAPHGTARDALVCFVSWSRTPAHRNTQHSLTLRTRSRKLHFITPGWGTLAVLSGFCIIPAHGLGWSRIWAACSPRVHEHFFWGLLFHPKNMQVAGRGSAGCDWGRVPHTVMDLCHIPASRPAFPGLDSGLIASRTEDKLWGLLWGFDFDTFARIYVSVCSDHNILFSFQNSSDSTQVLSGLHLDFFLR